MFALLLVFHADVAGDVHVYVMVCGFVLELSEERRRRKSYRAFPLTTIFTKR